MDIRKVCPAKDLPQELLGEIFIRCSPENIRYHIQPDLNLPPLVFSYVCRSWRNAALRNPRLWQKLRMDVTIDYDQETIPLWQLDALQYWASRMGSLLPSLYFRHVAGLSFDGGVVPCSEFFNSSVVSKAQALTMLDFFDFDLLVNIPFNHLEYLSIILPEYETKCSLDLPLIPTLRRLYICLGQAHINPLPQLSWETLTHLGVSVTIRFEEFCDILAQCVNLSRCCVWIAIRVVHVRAGPAMPHHNLRMLSLQGETNVAVGIFTRFSFPSLLALRLSYLTPRLKDIHRVVHATPRLKEFHLQLYSNDVNQFIGEAQDPRLAGALSKFLPGLVRLVIEPSFTFFDPSHQIFSILHSGWLENSHSELTVEFIFGCPEIAHNVILDTSSFRAVARCVPGGLWRRRLLSVEDLMDRWDDKILDFSVLD